MDFFTVDGNKIHKLFVDANSIIYDCKHKLNQCDFKNHEAFENKIIDDVIHYLDELIKKLIQFMEHLSHLMGSTLYENGTAAF